MDKDITKNISHLAILLILAIVLIIVLMYTGIIGCNTLPEGCNVYYALFRGGSPNILIAYGTSGMGDHTKLESDLSNRTILGAHVTAMPIDRLSYGNMKDYDLIIVEQAKQVCSSELLAFENYVDSGGRLIWTGDAGTQPCTGDSLLLNSERVQGGAKTEIGPWARKLNGKQLSFDEFLGVNYKANYCDVTQCANEEQTGFIEAPDLSEKLVYGLSPSIKFTGNFAIVQLNQTSSPRLVANLNYGSNLLVNAGTTANGVEKQQVNYGKMLPFIVTNGVGERVAYYATPPETFMEQGQPYKALLEQMYYGMLYE